MKIIIDLLPELSTILQLDAVKEYIRLNTKDNGDISPTKKDCADKIEVYHGRRVHVMCRNNKKSVSFKTWRAV